MSMIETIPKIKRRYLPVREMRITAGADQQRGQVQHGAIDIGIPVGTPVYAIADSEVIAVNRVNEVHYKQGGTGQGSCGSNVALIFKHLESPTGYSFVNYCHLKSIAPSLTKGMKIKGGTKIGTSGGKPGDPGAGNTTGPHLHLSIRLGDNRFKGGNAYSANPDVYNTFFDKAGIPPRVRVWPFLALVAVVGAVVYRVKKKK